MEDDDEDWLSDADPEIVAAMVTSIESHINKGGYIHEHTRQDMRTLLYYISYLENRLDLKNQLTDFKEVLNTGA
jgi:hypothetical protein